MALSIHGFGYDHGKIEVTVCDDAELHPITTEFNVTDLLERQADAKALWEGFARTVVAYVEDVMMSALRGAVVPDRMPVDAPPVVCRICGERQIPGTDDDEWLVMSPSRAYCPRDRVHVDGG